jgi:predicted NBD/HSP70 family sugar kinase
VSQKYPAGPQSLLRSINGRAVLELIGRVGPVTCTELAAQTGLSRPTVSAALTQLVDRGVVNEIGPATGRKGPAAERYQVNAECAWAIGVDVGHTRVRVGFADVTGQVRARAEEPARPGGRDTLIAQIVRMCTDVAEQFGIGLAGIAQVVMGMPAVVGPDGRTLSYAAGLPDAGHGLGHGLGEAIPVPLHLENDVNLAALAERTHGHGAQVDDFVLVSLGVGLGLGLVIGGRLRRGAYGVAGEAGYLPSDRAVAPPGHRRDLVQDHLGARYITAEAKRLGLPPDVTPRTVFELARAGDPAAVRIVDDTARSLAYVVACVIPLVDPALVVLGGAIGANGDLLLAPVARHIEDFSPFRPRIVSSDLGPDAVLIGATAMSAELAREAAFSTATGTPDDPTTRVSRH